MSILDKLPKINLPFLSKQDAGEFYFAVTIGFSSVTAAVWGIEHGRLQIISSNSQKYQSEHELLDAANYALDIALGDFQPEPEQVLFGVPETWLQDENLKPEHLTHLKHIVKELGLQPMAYVSTAHAVSHLIQKTQGVPVAAVIVENDDPLVVSVVKGGKIIGSKKHKRTDDLPKDIEKALLSFSEVEVLPSKIMILGGNDRAGGDHLKEELQSYSWMAQLPFLHLPKIELLSPEMILDAICYAGASEIDPGVNFHPKHLNPGAESKHKNSVVNSMDSLGADEVLPVHHRRGSHPENAEDPGFINGDIAEDGKKVHEDTARFALDEDMPQTHNLPIKRQMAAVESEEEEEYPPEAHYESETSLVEKIMGLIPFVGGRDSHHPKTPGGGIVGLLTNKIVLFGFILIIALGVAFIVLPKATVKVFIDMQTLSKDSTIIADPSISALDETNKKIPGTVLDTQVEGSAKGSATGKKQVGESAKGTVIIYNKTSSPKTFGPGTVLVGPDNLTFTIDTSVQVASQSAFESGISFGKATVNATASQIGPDSNLPAGKELSVKDNSTDNFSAKIDQAFSGGVSKDVAIVTADDQKRLLAQLSAELRTKSKEQIQGKLTNGLKIIEDGISEQIVSQTYSKKVGDQASEFSLNMVAKYKGTAYNENDLKTLVSKMLDTNVPEGFELDLSQTETQADITKVEKDGTLVFTAKYKAKLKPKVDVEQLKKQIAGKTEDVAAEKLKEIGNVIGSDIEIKPSLPKPLNLLPFLAKNISIEVTAK